MSELPTLSVESPMSICAKESILLPWQLSCMVLVLRIFDKSQHFMLNGQRWRSRSKGESQSTTSVRAKD